MGKQHIASEPTLALLKQDGLTVSDFDGNGLADIFTAAYNDSYRVWFNRGNGIFRP